MDKVANSGIDCGVPAADIEVSPVLGTSGDRIDGITGDELTYG